MSSLCELIKFFIKKMNNNEIFNYIYIYLLCTFSGKYKTQLYDSGRGDWLPSSPGIGMHVEVFINY